MKTKILVKVTITVDEDFNFSEFYNNNFMFRTYLDPFIRVDENCFISKALLNENGSVDKDELDIRLSLFDWAFNVPEESESFFNAHPDGFAFKLTYLSKIKF